MRCAVVNEECVPGRLKKGLCSKHYQRQRSSGTTSAPQKASTLTRYETDEKTGCWLYTGPLYSNGYGKLSREEHGTRLAHRASFIEHRPEVKIDGFDLDHMCRDRSCINPWHLDRVPRGQNLSRGYDVRNQGLCRNLDHRMAGDNVGNLNGYRYCRECKKAKDRRSGARYREARRADRGNDDQQDQQRYGIRDS